MLVFLVSFLGAEILWKVGRKEDEVPIAQKEKGRQNLKFKKWTKNEIEEWEVRIEKCH